MQELQEVFIKIQASFYSSQNTGKNCHFTDNTGITGAMPGIHTHKNEKQGFLSDFCQK